MALTLSIEGPDVVATKTTSNATGNQIIDNFLQAYGQDPASMTDQEKAEFVISALSQFMVKTARGKAVDLASAAAADTTQEEYPEWIES